MTSQEIKNPDVEKVVAIIRAYTTSDTKQPEDWEKWRRQLATEIVDILTCCRLNGNIQHMEPIFGEREYFAALAMQGMMSMSPEELLNCAPEFESFLG